MIYTTRVLIRVAVCDLPAVKIFIDTGGADSGRDNCKDIILIQFVAVGHILRPTVVCAFRPASDGLFARHTRHFRLL